MGETGADRPSGPVIHSAMPAWATGRSQRRMRRRKWPRKLWIFAAAGVGLGLAAYAALPDAPFSLDGAPLVGQVERVVDGDTIDIAGQRVRLTGLDAPEWSQTCGTADGGTWECGATAARGMRELTRSRTLTCRPEGHDRYGRLLATCRDGQTDIAEALVGDGLALATGRYAAAEGLARQAGSGLWQGRFDTPAEWRRRTASGTAAEAGNPSRFDRFVAWLWGLLSS